MRPKEQIVDLPVYQPGKPVEEVRREYNLTDVIKLASNENPFGASPQVKEVIVKECSNLGLYPDGYAQEIRTAIAQYYELDEKQLIFGNGSDNIIQMICASFLEPGTHTIMAKESFPEYRTYAIINGAELSEVPLTNGVHDLEEMASCLREETSVIWVCNPNNPSGTYVTHDELVQFLEKVPNDVLVVLDEAYVEYVTVDDFPDGLALLEKYPNVIILRTFSKIYGLAALRIGYGIAAPKIIDLLNRVREPFNVSRIAQSAAIAALGDQHFRQACYTKNKAGKEQFYAAFEDMGLSYYPSEANFILVDIGRPAQPVFQQLLEQGLIVRSGEALQFPTCLRITIGSAEQNEKIITALQAILVKTS